MKINMKNCDCIDFKLLRERNRLEYKCCLIKYGIIPYRSNLFKGFNNGIRRNFSKCC